MPRHHCADCVTDKSITEMWRYGDTAFFFSTMKDGECDTSNKCHCIPSVEIYAVNCRVLKVCFFGIFLFVCLDFFF